MITVRKLMRADARAVMRVCCPLLSGDLHPRFIEEDCLDYLEVAADTPKMGAFVAERDGEIVGCIIGVTGFWPWNWADKYVTATVLAGVRCGKPLVLALKAWARSQGIARVLIGSSCGNDRADEFLATFGGGIAIKTWRV